MRKLTLTAIATLLAGTATAADMRMPVKAPIAPVVQAAYNWTGFYVGGHVGYGWGDTDWRLVSGVLSGIDADPLIDGNPLRYDIKGVLGGGQIGFNYQTGPWVFGLEASLSGSGIKGTSRGAVDDAYTAKINWLFLGTGRLGWAADRALFYVKGGGAAASVRSTVADPDVGDVNTSARVTHTGWTAGGGIEYGITPWLSLAGEYNYVSLSAKNHDWNFDGSTLVVRSDPDLHVVWAKLNFRWSGGAPVVARY